jgi:hypothetical protein
MTRTFIAAVFAVLMIAPAAQARDFETFLKALEGSWSGQGTYESSGQYVNFGVQMYHVQEFAGTWIGDINLRTQSGQSQSFRNTYTVSGQVDTMQTDEVSGFTTIEWVRPTTLEYHIMTSGRSFVDYYYRWEVGQGGVSVDLRIEVDGTPVARESWSASRSDE